MVLELVRDYHHRDTEIDTQLLNFLKGNARRGNARSEQFGSVHSDDPIHRKGPVRSA